MDSACSRPASGAGGLCSHGYSSGWNRGNMGREEITGNW